MGKVSLNTLAKELNLSKTTVSMVLNGHGSQHKINAMTQERVFKLAKQYNYRPNQIARNLSKGKTMTLGLILPNVSDNYFSSCAYHFEDLASEIDYRVLLGSTREDNHKEIGLLETFEDQRVDGILIASTQHNLPAIQRMHDGGLPIVLFDRNYPGTNLPTVNIDNYGGLRLLVEYMNGQKRKKIGYIGVDLDLIPLNDRRKGLIDRSKELGLDYCLEVISYKNFKEECGVAVSNLLNEHQCDAILFETPYLTLYGIKHLNLMSVKYHQDVTIASFGDNDTFSIYDPQITAIDLQPDQIIKSAVDILVSCINKDESALTRVISPKLIVRA